MLRVLAYLDRLATRTRPAWAWLGQLAVVVLGVHLAADRLDDSLLVHLGSLPLPWPSAETPIYAAALCAVTLELLVCGWAAWMLVRTAGLPAWPVARWRDRVSLSTAMVPLFWIPVALAGCWVLGMAAEDLLFPYAPRLARPAGWMVALLCAWRLGFSGLHRALRHSPKPRSRLAGAASAPLLLLFAALATMYGLPLQGWGA